MFSSTYQTSVLSNHLAGHSTGKSVQPFSTRAKTMIALELATGKRMKRRALVHLLLRGLLFNLKHLCEKARETVHSLPGVMSTLH